METIIYIRVKQLEIQLPIYGDSYGDMIMNGVKALKRLASITDDYEILYIL